jgi:hypothetical protein
MVVRRVRKIKIHTIINLLFQFEIKLNSENTFLTKKLNFNQLKSLNI